MKGEIGRLLTISSGRCAEDPDGTALVVSDRVSHCQVICRSARKTGMRVDLLTGQTRLISGRQSSLRSRRARCRFWWQPCSSSVRGSTAPGLSSLFLTTPITFEGRLLQVIGRIMRPAENKAPCVYDYVDDQVSALRRSAAARQKVLAQACKPFLQPPGPCQLFLYNWLGLLVYGGCSCGRNVADCHSALRRMCTD